MARIISFVLGNIWRWEKSKNRNDFIKYAKNLDIGGVDLAIKIKYNSTFDFLDFEIFAVLENIV